MNIAILGTGAVGTALGKLFLSQGHHIQYGSRTPERTQSRVPSGAAVTSFREAVAFGKVVLLAIPWAGETGRVTLEVLASAGSFDSKIIVDATNPLHLDWSPFSLGDQHSAGESIAAAVPRAVVVKAFNTIFADAMTTEQLHRQEQKITAFLCGDNQAAKDVVAQLAKEIGFRPLDTGNLKNSRYLEAMAHLNIQIAVTKGHGTKGAFLYTHG